MTWADRIAGCSSKLKAVYFHFDNDDSACAAHYAIELKQLVSERLRTKDKEGSVRYDTFADWLAGGPYLRAVRKCGAVAALGTVNSDEI